MKKVIVYMFLFISIGINAQIKFPIDSITGKVAYTGVVSNSITKPNLFSNAKTWITKSFLDYKNVIQFEDKESGKLVLTGSSFITSYIDKYGARDLNCTITIECKNSKYKYYISDIYMILADNSLYPIEDRINWIEKIKKESFLLKNIDQSTISKKDIKKNSELIAINEEYILETDKSFSSMNDSFNRLCENLIKSMSINNDF